MDVQGNWKDEGKQQASNNVDPEDNEALGLEGWDCMLMKHLTLVTKVTPLSRKNSRTSIGTLDFRKGAIVGLYMGGDVGDPKYSITPGWPAAKDVTCFPFTNPMALEARSTKTTGLRMMNDPSFWLSNGEVPQVEVNVEVYSDLFAVVLKDIKKGEEFFMSYQLEEWKRKAEDENNDGDHKKKARGESDEEGDGKQLSV
eukprot:scaffold5077_cov95-Amphora_coffeaeformis.AAC.3